ncbi:hypothetical protein [Streptomyces sp. NPDC057002]|uniref:hypothetical protein n=1 Tax=Streptomyces sp. NPDC057002 TaxID=3345992 RepID=UPI003636744F
MQQMTVFTVEVYDCFTAATIGFYPITTASVEDVDGLATELLIAMGHGRNAALDWRQIAEHPFNPAVPDTPALRLVSKS